jgi:hypothetical protein
MNTTYRDVNHLFHRLWTRAVGTPDYNKADWKALEHVIETMWREATGKHPRFEDALNVPNDMLQPSVETPPRPTAWARLLGR